MRAPSTTPGHLVINLDLKVKTKTKTGDKLRAPGASNRYGIIFQPSISAFGFRFPYLGGSIFLILLLRGGLTTYPPIWDPRSGAPLRAGASLAPVGYHIDRHIYMIEYMDLAYITCRQHTRSALILTVPYHYFSFRFPPRLLAPGAVLLYQVVRVWPPQFAPHACPTEVRHLVTIVTQTCTHNASQSLCARYR